MANYSQDNSPIAIETALGKDKLLLASFSHEATVSQPFRVRARALSEDKNLDIKSLIRTGATIEINKTNDPESPQKKYINGRVVRAVMLEETEYLTEYELELVPWLSLLDLFEDCRIFQNKTTEEIIQQVFGDAGFTDFKFDLQGSTRTREYCVQYREHHRNFVQRLLEEEGMFYWFKHENGKHTMIIGNANSKFEECPKGTIHYELTKSHTWEEEIRQIDISKQARTNKETRRDYFFEDPSLDLTSSQTSGETGGSEEVYSYPGRYFQKSLGDDIVDLLIDHQDSHVTRVNFKGTARDLFCGCRVKISDHFCPEINDEVIVLWLREGCDYAGYRSGTRNAGGGNDDFKYENEVISVPNKGTYRPPRSTPWPRVEGIQTAVVVGPKGEEIYTDKYGRIKVQFHWDREGKKDENSSCWIRVGTLWAGKNWGMIHIPRIGQEVVVDFLEGDPDRPLAIGSVYNAEQMPPYSLPANMTQSGLKSRSSKGGGGDNFNEIRFEDKKGSEEVYIHAEKDLNEIVENSRAVSILGGDDSLTIKKGDRSTTIEKGGRTTKIKKDDKLEVEGNTDTDVKLSMKEKAGTSHDTEAGTTMKIKAGTMMTIEAGAQIEIKAGSGKIVLNAMGVTITGALVKIN